jgi:hypothetical protein
MLWNELVVIGMAHLITRVDPDIFDGIALFYQNKCYFVAYDKLFLEKSLRTHFCQFGFP